MFVMFIIILFINLKLIDYVIFIFKVIIIVKYNFIIKVFVKKINFNL